MSPQPIPTIVILTALEVEYEAVRLHLSKIHTKSS